MDNKKAQDFQVGQKLFAKIGYNRELHELTIEKVGRKWITLGNRYRADIDTLIIDGRGYASPGRCYLSAEEYENEMELNRAWSKLKGSIGNSYNPPPGITTDAIMRAMTLLCLED